MHYFGHVGPSDSDSVWVHSEQVVGEKEEAEGTVNVRTRDNIVHGMHALDAVQEILLREKDTRSLTSIFGAEETVAAPQNGAGPAREQDLASTAA